jgi:hypothetical protein
MLDKFFTWIVQSSANPEETAMTIKGVIILQVPVALNILSQFGVNLDKLVIVNDISIAALVFGACLGIVGIIRKVYLTIKEVAVPPVAQPALPSESKPE